MFLKVSSKEHLIFFKLVLWFFIHNNHFWLTGLPFTVCAIKSEGVSDSNDLCAVFGIGISVVKHQYSIWVSNKSLSVRIG